LHYACSNNQSESVIQFLVKEYPLAVQQKLEDDYFPLHLACRFNQSESVIQLLVKEYPLAVQQKEIYDCYPLHLACRFNQLENIILTLIDTYLLAVNQEDPYGDNPLDHARINNQSERVIKVLQTLKEKSDYELENRIDIPMMVLAHGLGNKRRYDITKWIFEIHTNMPVNITTPVNVDRNKEKKRKEKKRKLLERQS
jgi:ankyrin repeat protein